MKTLLKSARTWGLAVVPLLVIAWLYLTDPDNGASTRDMLQGIAAGALAVTLCYLARKAVLNYIKLEDIVEAAKRSATGAGLVFLGVMIFMSALLLMLVPSRAPDRCCGGLLSLPLPSEVDSRYGNGGS